MIVVTLASFIFTSLHPLEKKKKKLRTFLADEVSFARFSLLVTGIQLTYGDHLAFSFSAGDRRIFFIAVKI